MTVEAGASGGERGEPTSGGAVSRRRLLGAGVAGAAAAGLASVSSAGALPALAADGTESALAGSAAAPIAAALPAPSLIAGATTKAVGVLGSAVAMNAGTGTTLVFAAGYAYPNGGGWIDLALGLPAGSRLARVDVFGHRDTAGVQAWKVYRHDLLTPGLSLVADIATPSGDGPVTASHSFSPFVTVGPGDNLVVELTGAAAGNAATGAICQYFPSSPNVTFHPAPIRVYDSRSSFSPPVTPKAPMTNGTTRTIDCSYGGGVATNASAAIVNVTATDTDGGGFLGAFKNGIAWPGNSTVNWDHGASNVGNLALVALDTAGRIELYCAGRTDVVVDVLGYYS